MAVLPASDPQAGEPLPEVVRTLREARLRYRSGISLDLQSRRKACHRLAFPRLAILQTAPGQQHRLEAGRFQNPPGPDHGQRSGCGTKELQVHRGRRGRWAATTWESARAATLRGGQSVRGQARRSGSDEFPAHRPAFLLLEDADLLVDVHPLVSGLLQAGGLLVPRVRVLHSSGPSMCRPSRDPRWPAIQDPTRRRRLHRCAPGGTSRARWHPNGFARHAQPSRQGRQCQAPGRESPGPRAWA